MTDSVRANGRLPQDYHMHSNQSPDCQATMAQMCRSALAQGLAEIAFTEHFDLHPGEPTVGYYQPARYFERLEAARAEFAPLGLTIRAGVELGEPHRFGAQQRAVLEQYPFDIVLGSLHWIGDDCVFDPDVFKRRSAPEVIGAYFRELEQMVRAGGFDVLAHADVFKRVAATVYGPLTSADWHDLIVPVWRACIETGTGIEINTATLRRGGPETHPGPAPLHWYRELGGEILTIGSDSHAPNQVASGLQIALEEARAAGFRHVAIFERRRVVRWAAI